MDIKSLVKKATGICKAKLKKVFDKAFDIFSKTADRLKGIGNLKTVSFAKRHKIMLTFAAALTATVMLTSVVFIKRNEVAVFVDGEEVSSFTTLKNDVGQWLDLAGVEVYDGDSVTAQDSCVYIDRAFYVTVKADGTQVTLKTVKAPVADVLEKAEVSVSDEDIVSVPLDTVLRDDAVIEISRVSSATVKETKTVEYETEKVKTDELYVGQSKVKTQGENGKVEYTYAVTYVDGNESERRLVSEQTVKEAVNKVVLVGTKKKPQITTSSTPSSYKAVYTMTATAYTYGDDGGNRTATGIRPYRGIVAVDPNVIPLGTKLYIETSDGRYIYGSAVAADTGGAIKGNKIDIFLESESECYSFGRRSVNVYVIG